MTNNDDTLIDKDGIVYKKGSDGQYRPQSGFWGPERDTTWTGQPKVKYDWLGNPQEIYDWLGNPIQSYDGEILYRRSEDSNGSSRGGSSSSSDGWPILLFFAAYAYVIIVAVVFACVALALAATPIIAPILLAIADSARKRGDVKKFKKWEELGIIASVLGVLVVIVIAMIIGCVLMDKVLLLIQNTTSSVLIVLIYMLAATVGFVSMTLLLITGISPTAIVYLRQKELQLRSIGNAETAIRVRLLYWTVGIVAAITTGSTLVIALVLAVMQYVHCITKLV